MKKWEPVNGGKYWYITVDVRGITYFYTTNETTRDKARFKIGNCFRSRCEVQQVASKIRQLLR